MNVCCEAEQLRMNTMFTGVTSVMENSINRLTVSVLHFIHYVCDLPYDDPNKARQQDLHHLSSVRVKLLKATETAAFYILTTL